MAPRVSMLDIETADGPLQLRDLAGNIRLRATNGPVALVNVSGIVETSVTNGPISLTGASGDHRVLAVNGPVSIVLSGNHWDGSRLEVSATNDPLSLVMLDAYGSGILIQTHGHSSVNCKAPACAAAPRTINSSQIIQVGNCNPMVRLFKENGSLTILPSRR